MTYVLVAILSAGLTFSHISPVLEAKDQATCETARLVLLQSTHNIEFVCVPGKLAMPIEK
jgi:hypothetical protein